MISVDSKAPAYAQSAMLFGRERAHKMYYSDNSELSLGETYAALRLERPWTSPVPAPPLIEWVFEPPCGQGRLAARQGDGLR